MRMPRARKQRWRDVFRGTSRGCGRALRCAARFQRARSSMADAHIRTLWTSKAPIELDINWTNLRLQWAVKNTTCRHHVSNLSNFLFINYEKLYGYSKEVVTRTSVPTQSEQIYTITISEFISVPRIHLWMLCALFGLERREITYLRQPLISAKGADNKQKAGILVIIRDNFVLPKINVEKENQYHILRKLGTIPYNYLQELNDFKNIRRLSNVYRRVIN